MPWRRTDPVQEVGGLLLSGRGAAKRLHESMTGKPPLLRALDTTFGEDWAVVFAGRAADGELLLPWLEGVTPLHEAWPGWWLPVGVDLDLPEPIAPALLAVLAERYGFRPPAILVPRLDETPPQADAYPIAWRAPFNSAGVKPDAAGSGKGS